MSISSVKIVGSGLIGTSIGLALKQKGVAVLMADSNLSAASLAQSLVDPNQSLEKNHVFDVVIISVPPSAFSSALAKEYELHPLSTFVDTLSIKIKPQVEVESFPGLIERFVGSHPMAGREVSGAQSARGDLFVGRPWIICPSAQVNEASVTFAKELIDLCGGVAITMQTDEHDQAMALVSHAPQVIASLMASMLKIHNPQWLDLIGQGFKDMTRIADSDADLWREILSVNSINVSKVLADFRNQLQLAEEGLSDSEYANSIIESGNSGRALIPGKHGGSPRMYIYLHIVIDDRAGQLAAIFNDCAIAEVNIEDVSIEHTPGQNTGLVTLSVLNANKAEHLRDFLISKGWKVHSTSK